MTEVEIFKQSLDVSRIVMLITIIMTIISATFSALSLAFQRSHNRKSVKPLCNLIKIMDKNSVQIIVENAGLGPMIIRDIALTSTDSKNINLCTYFDKLLSNRNVFFIELKREIIIPANEQKIIFELKASDNDKSIDMNDLIIKLKKNELVINYCDIYDKEYRINENL
jgi:hypothetical protein